MPRRLPARPRAAAAALLLGAACYRHVPVDPAPLPAGAPVRLYLTSDGTTQLAARLGPSTVAVEGCVDSVGAGGVSVAVTQTTKSFGGAVTWVGEHVTIPTGLVARAERRVLDRRRTTVASVLAALAAGAAIATLVAQHGAGGGGAPPGGGVTP